MVELITSYTLAQIPYLTYDSLDEYAEELINDFAPEMLQIPGSLDVDNFIEYYLNLTVDYQRLCITRKILGITAFNDGVVDIVCSETNEPHKIAVKAGTIILDPSLLTKRNIPRMRFTMLHEGSHWLLHRKAFSEGNPFVPTNIYEGQLIAAKTGRVDYSRSKKERTDTDRMERQADFLASAIIMNRSALRVAFKDFFALYDEKPRRIIRGTSTIDDLYAKRLPEYIAKTFGVSKRAALIRLEKLSAIVDSEWQRA